ncbi:hypothetical protein BDD12DRAFT_889428 [Trichophaea hybrida]|nr:hypothetical protein BDD12DRAFT_889428 [Trichophaea hybrida]
MTGQEIQNTHSQHMDRYQVHDLNRQFPPLGVPLPQKRTISETELEHDQEAKSARKKKKKLMTIKRSEAGKKDPEDKKKTLKNRKSANTHGQEAEKNAEEDEDEKHPEEKGVKNKKKLKLGKASDQTKNKKAGRVAAVRRFNRRNPMAPEEGVEEVEDLCALGRC